MRFSALLLVGVLATASASVLRMDSRTANGQKVEPFWPEATGGGSVAHFWDKIPWEVVAGNALGAVLGGSAGALAGNAEAIKSPMYGGIAGGVAGFIAGGVVAYSPFGEPREEPEAAWGKSTEEPKVEEEETKKPKITTEELPQPAITKMQHQAELAVALSNYEEQQATDKGDKKEAKEEAHAEKKAVKALQDISENIEKREKTGKKPATADSQKDFENVQEVLAEGDTAEMISAESALANDAAVTANDLARVAGGGKGKRFRGEDVGPGKGVKSYQGDMIARSAKSKKQLKLFESFTEGSQLEEPKLEMPWAEEEKLEEPKGAKQIAAGAPFPKGKINYCFASDVSETVKKIFRAATDQYKRAVPSCLTFEDVGWKKGKSDSEEQDQLCKKSPAIFVQSDANRGCFSEIGFQEGMDVQRLQLQDPGCMSVGTAVHELGHALGMAHEQARPDRDQHVKIHFNNIPEDMRDNFAKDKKGYTGQKYDLLSVMHYDRFAFAKDETKPTIDFLGIGANEGLGQRIGLSKFDVGQVVAMYKEENKQCKGSELAGMGCVDKPNKLGKDVCKGRTECNAEGINKCCACGGGAALQCYKGQHCPKPKKMLRMDPKECLVESTALFAGRGLKCVYQNECSFPVSFKCSGGCENVADPQSYSSTKCNGKEVTDVCMAKDKCTFSILKDKKGCPKECLACKPGAVWNGGKALSDNKCKHSCSRPFGASRYCGGGKVYGGDGSVDCTGC